MDDNYSQRPGSMRCGTCQNYYLSKNETPCNACSRNYSEGIKWNRSREGFTDSKCGRFTISPRFFGACSIQMYVLKDSVSGVEERADTQAEAKQKAHDSVR